MRFGVNLIKLDQLDYFIELYNLGEIDFIEILLDNFWNFEPEVVFYKLRNVPVSFHIMNSLYMERENYELEKLANKILHFAAYLNPIYISDHLFKSKENNIIYPMLIECDYKNEYKLITSKIKTWENLLNTKIYIENFASIFEFGIDQINFFEKANLQDDIYILFDFSNALIAATNNKFSIELWGDLIRSTSHFHISGYRNAQGLSSNIILDTHDVRISELTKSFFKNFKEHLLSENTTMVVEYDKDITFAEWMADINELKGLIR